MSTFSAAPTDNRNHCSKDLNCQPGYKCFLYSTGTLCQPYTPPAYYPPVNSSDVLGWYFSPYYPSLRYTGALANQTQGANCTTVPLPPPGSDSSDAMLDYVTVFDYGTMIFKLEKKFQNTILSNRGNCVEGFYCSPTIPPPAINPGNFSGQVPGTCQPEMAEGQPCTTSNQCKGWHINSDLTFDNSQVRCILSDENTPSSGVCSNIKAGNGVVVIGGQSSFFQTTARTYLLSALLLFFLALLFLWYRRQKNRQNQMNYPPYDSTNAYLRNEGVHRTYAEPDDGELPSYGQHRRDARLVGPTPEEISMYTYPNQQSQSQPHPSQPYYAAPPPNFSQNVQQPLYAPPLSPPPMTPQEAEVAALSAAAAAAIATPLPTASAALAQNSLPSYESNNTNSSTVLESGGPPREKESFEALPRSQTQASADNEKPPKKNKDQDNDGESTSSGSGSGSSSHSPFNG